MVSLFETPIPTLHLQEQAKFRTAGASEDVKDREVPLHTHRGKLEVGQEHQDRQEPNEESAAKIRIPPSFVTTQMIASESSENGIFKTRL